MTPPKEDGGPAYPASVRERVLLGGPNAEVEWQPAVHPGMSLRDYFAASALPWLLENGHGEGLTPSEIASDAYGYADAMLKAREDVKP